MTITPEQRAAWRKVAEAARPGPWSAVPYLYDDGGDERVRVSSPDDGDDYNLAEGVLRADARHIATFDPPTVLALIAAHEEALTALEAAHKCEALCNDVERERDHLFVALEAKTAEVDEARKYRALPHGYVWQDYYSPDEVIAIRREVEFAIETAERERDEARAALKAKDSYVGDLEEQIQHIKSLWRATGRTEADQHRRADRAEAVLERVRAVRSFAPECDKYDDNEPITCGWKRTVQRIDAVLEALERADRD